MQKFIFFYCLLIATLWTACGDDTAQLQLQDEQAVFSEQSTKIAAELKRLQVESAELQKMAADVKDKPEIAVLLDQYNDIYGSLASMQRWYAQNTTTYDNLIAGQQQGEINEDALRMRTKGLQEKAAAIDKKVAMTITELERMRGDIETTIQYAKENQ